MKKWMSGIRGALLMIGLWVVGWGIGFGGIMELVDPDGKIQDVWPTLFAVPGFIGGIIFAGLLMLFDRARAFHQRSFLLFAIGGAFTGLVLGLLSIPAEVGDVSPGAAGMVGFGAALGLVSGVGCWIFCRLATRGKAVAA